MRSSDLTQLRLPEVKLHRPLKVEYPKHHDDAITIVNQSLIHILAFLIELA